MKEIEILVEVFDTKDRVKEIQKSLGHNKREIKIRDLNFDIMVYAEL